jgi:hypothetical protein
VKVLEEYDKQQISYTNYKVSDEKKKSCVLGDPPRSVWDREAQFDKLCVIR